MKIKLSAEDAAQVNAILNTHAEMQDMRVNEPMAVLARLQRDEPGEVDVIAELRDNIEMLEQDSQNLKRIAGLFPS